MSPVRTKVLSLRLPEDIAEDVAAVARANGVSVSRAIRMAIEDYLAANLSDPTFQERVKRRLKEDVEAAQRLAARVTK